MIVATLIAAIFSGSPVVLTASAQVALATPSIRLGDIAYVTDQRLRYIELARLPRGTSRLVLTRAALAGLVRRALPGLSVGEGAGGSVTFRFTLPARPAARSHDLPKLAPPLIVRGDQMTLVSRNGPVTIERSVTALQPGAAGGRVFVRDGAGHVFALPIEKGTK